MNITLQSRPKTYAQFRSALTRYYNGQPQSNRDVNGSWRWFKAGRTDISAAVKYLLSLPVL